MVGYLHDAGGLRGIGGRRHSGDVCGGTGVFGGIAHDGDILFVPCTNAVVQVTVNPNSFAIGWSAPMSNSIFTLQASTRKRARFT